MRLFTLTAAAAITLTAGTSYADIVFTQSSSQTAYTDHSVTFDEAGVPVGVVVDPFDHYQASDGIVFTSNNGFLMAEDWDTLEGIDGGEGDGNQLQGGFGIRMNFDNPISELSFQGWANGSPSPPFGGINIFAFLDGAEVGAYFGTQAPFGGVGDEWFTVNGTGGMVFDEIVFFNPAFNSFSSYVDNVTWNDVPAPGAMALFALAGLARRRRRN